MESPSFIFSSGPIEVKSEGENIFVEGYIATDDLDLVNDIVTKSCMLDMAEQMQERTIKLDFEHESMRGDSELDMQLNKTINPVAKIEDFSMDKKGLKIKAKLNRHTPKFNEIKNSIEDGFLDAFSIAYIPTETKDDIRNGQEVRLLDKVNLLNIAFTGTAINPKATIEKVFMKSLDYLKAKPKKPKPQPDPHKEPDEDDDDEEETKTGKHSKKKKQYKSYEKDGAHAHTEDEPLGLHNHPEIESMIRNMGEQANDRINFLSDRVYELIGEDGKELTSSDALALKSKITKEKHNHENDIIKLKEVKNMTEDEEKKKLEEEAAKKAEAEVKAKAKAEAEAKAEDEKVAKEAEEKEAAEKETANKEEVKALTEKVEEQAKDLAEIKSLIVKPIKKSMQSIEDKSKNFEDKGLNPLDMIA